MEEIDILDLIHKTKKISNKELILKVKGNNEGAYLKRNASEILLLIQLLIENKKIKEIKIEY